MSAAAAKPPLSIAEKLQRAAALKEQGNAAFKEGAFGKALSSYTKIFAWTDGLIMAPAAMMESQLLGAGKDPSKLPAQPTDDEKAEIVSLQSAAALNSSLCYLKLQNPAKAAAMADKALKIDPRNAKAYYRRALAYEESGDLDKSESDLAAAHSLTPNDAIVKQAQDRIKEKLSKSRKAADEAMRRNFAAAFSGAKK